LIEGHTFAIFKMGQVRKLRFWDWRFVKIDNFRKK